MQTLDRLRLAGRSQCNSGGGFAHGAELVQQVNPDWRDRQRPPDPVEQYDTQRLL
jgi:hypothetical protein